jgi:hypothetical protein
MRSQQQKPRRRRHSLYHVHFFIHALIITWFPILHSVAAKPKCKKRPKTRRRDIPQRLTVKRTTKRPCRRDTLIAATAVSMPSEHAVRVRS